jgi:hypothetical protein
MYSRRIRGIPYACLETANTDFFVRRGYVNIIGTYVSGGDISLKNQEFMKLK